VEVTTGAGSRSARTATSVAEKGRLKAKRDQLFRTGDIEPAKLRAIPFRALWRRPAIRARITHIGGEFTPIRCVRLPLG
jgi:hypothetical protein